MAHGPTHPHQHADVQDVVRHEESDVNVRAILGFGAGLLAVVALVAAAVWVFFLSLGWRAERSAARVSPLTVEQRELVPPGPRLQVNPREDMRQLRAAEDAVLNGYSWVDRNAGVVRIPIDEAIRLTLERGLPFREAAPKDTR